MRIWVHVRGALLWAGLLVLLEACGAKTGLRVDYCEDEGLVRSCSTGCGPGTQTCQRGLWSECQVTVSERSCTNECGEGSQSCVDDRWTTCAVPVAERSCTNDCGEGTQVCSDGSWSTCDVAEVVRRCVSVCGEGQERCVAGTWSACDAPQPKPPALEATIRDFQETHPDFEPDVNGEDYGIVAEDLGADRLPVYADAVGSTPTTTGKQNFDQWFRDVPGVNQSTSFVIPLQPVPGDEDVYAYDNGAFFPIDGQLFGNQGRRHNYHFTVELHSEFLYRGGERFTFRGDDDIWVFLNGKLAIDLGGLHSELTRTVNLDTRAEQLGLEPGNVYSFDLFFAERHTVESHFRIETTISEFANCD